jgi:hypothetical protein
LSIVGFSRTSAPRSLVSISLLQQNPDFTLLRSRIVDRMWTPNDLVKYYYIPVPTLVLNYTAFVTINTFTPGFSPFILTGRNDVILSSNSN